MSYENIPSSEFVELYFKLHSENGPLVEEAMQTIVSNLSFDVGLEEWIRRDTFQPYHCPYGGTLWIDTQFLYLPAGQVAIPADRWEHIMWRIRTGNDIAHADDIVATKVNQILLIEKDDDWAKKVHAFLNIPFIAIWDKVS